MKYLLPVLLLMGTESLCAQSILNKDKELSVSLGEVVVTGTGTEHYLKDAPVQTEVITGKALDNYQGRSIDDLLGGLCASLSFNSNDMGSNIQLNGLNNDYILILINGHRINGDNGGQNDLNLINVANIERIEIVKGAASSLYGSDAIAGVINIITKKNKDKFSASNNTRIGSYGDVNQYNQIGFKNKKWNSNTSFSVKHTDGWRNTDLEYYHYELREGTVTRTVNRNTNFNLREELTYKVNKKLTLGADASYYQKNMYRLRGAYKYALNDYFYRNQSYGANARYNLSGYNYLSAEVSYDRYQYYYDYTAREITDDFDKETGRRITHYPGDRILQTQQQQVLALVKGVFYLTEKNILSVGLEHKHDFLKAPHRIESEDASVFTSSVYAQDEWDFTERFNVTAGVRAVYHKEFGAKLTPKISALYKLGDFNLRGTYSYGFKAPTLKELYYNYVGNMMNKLKSYYGNKDLKPQTSNYGAVSVEYNLPKFRMSVTGYYNRIKDMIELTPIPIPAEDKFLEVQEAKQYKNLAKARSFGADVDLSYQILPSLTVSGSYSYVDAQAQYAGDPSDANYMKYVPINGSSKHNATWKANWGHSWKLYQLDVSIYGKYQSTRYYLTDGNGDGYQTWRINTSHSVLNTKKWKLNINAGIDNIFNYVDRTPFGWNHGSTTPGRTYYASVTVKFQNNSK